MYAKGLTTRQISEQIEIRSKENINQFQIRLRYFRLIYQYTFLHIIENGDHFFRNSFSNMFELKPDIDEDLVLDFLPEVIPLDIVPKD